LRFGSFKNAEIGRFLIPDHTYGGKAQIQLNRSSSIEELDEDIEVGTSTFTYRGSTSEAVTTCKVGQRYLFKSS